MVEEEEEEEEGRFGESVLSSDEDVIKERRAG